MSRADDPVLVAGAGPVGLVLALSLARRGCRAIVVEKLVDVGDQVRRAGTVHAATLEMLDDLGLYERLAPQGLIAPLVHYWERGAEEPIAVFDHAVLDGDTRFPHALQCDRLKIVLEALKMASGDDRVTVHTGAELVGFAQNGAGVEAEVRRADGAADRLRGSYLVSCEGAHSLVRKELGIGFEGFAFPDRTMTLSVAFDYDLIRPYGYRNYILDPVEWANLFKWTDFWRVVLPADPAADPDSLLDDEAVEAALQRFHRRPAVYEVISKSLYTVHQRVAESFRAGRVLLAGDAAHVNSPIGAMGTNSGIHDAVNLAAKLSAVLAGEAGPDLLDRYSRQRRHAAVAHVQAITIRNKKLMAEADPATRRRNRDELRRAADDPALAREHLLRASLIQSVRDAEQVA